jgi:DNA-binding transcriptional regulator PaaX|tara:strand:+ start:308 stop:499 length:192 start_codon:yes stop_codon:yes gene_type:complete
MSIEDILYEAYEEGLRDEVFTELKRMKKKGIMQGKELSDRYDYALTQVRKYKQARAKRGTENR